MKNNAAKINTESQIGAFRAIKN